MFQIISRDNRIVETVETVTAAHRLVDYMNSNYRQTAPYHCKGI